MGVAQQEAGNKMTDKASDQKGKDLKKIPGQKGGKPNWISAIEKNPNDITKYMWELFMDKELKTNIVEDLEKDAKSSK